LAFVLLLTIVGGCGDDIPQPERIQESRQPVPLSHFDPTAAGAIHGQVIWQGDVPVVSRLLVRANPIGGDALTKRQIQPNPNAPMIHSPDHGVGNAVVFLRGVDPAIAKPWNLPQLQVEQRGLQFHILQGDLDSPFGFVHRGDAIEMVSRDPYFHALHVGGASFFTLMFPDPDRPLTRPLKENGVVELSSAAGYYWMRAYLFVDDHPYYARTDKEGRFSFDRVPPGQYEMVCWMPNWQEARHERDPESGLITRLYFQPPATLVQKVELGTRESREIRFSPSMRDFQR
jgi:hypothetical protein